MRTFIAEAISMRPWRTIAYETAYSTATRVHAYWPFAVAAWTFGRTRGCSIRQTVRAFEQRRALTAIKAELAQASAVVQVDEDLECLQTPLGHFWVPLDNRDELFNTLGEQQLNIYGTPRGIALDCGANIGSWAQAALRTGASRVVALEPEPKNIECLRRNLAKEIAEGQVIVCPKGAWDRDDELMMHSDPGHCGSWSFVTDAYRPQASGIRLPLTTIDQVVSELKLPSVDFIKMDIEGAERRAINGAKETIQKWRPDLAICLYHLPDDPVAIPAGVRAIVPDYRTNVRATANQKIQPEIQYFHA